MARFTTERGLDRLVNFSDATVAIALTLLVLPLTGLANEARESGAGRLLTDHFAAVFSFALSFAVIAVLWREHHRLFEAFADYNAPVTVINFFWLLAIVVLPFSTEVNNQAPSGDRVSLALYIGNLLLAFAALAGIHLAAARDLSMIRPDRRSDFRAGSGGTLVVLCAVALVVALCFPAIGMWALLLLVLTGPVTRLMRARRRSR